MSMPRVGRGEGDEQGMGRKDTYLHYLEQRSMGRLRRGAGDRINRNLALDMLNPPPRCATAILVRHSSGPSIQNPCYHFEYPGIGLSGLILSIQRTLSMTFSITRYLQAC